MRHELRHGQHMTLTANINRNPDRELFIPTDFMNFLDIQEEKEMTLEELEAYADRCLGV